ncbi:hypothetical protein KSC_015690 [Ktedonobacter sp. SOSP1-52]|nr:hypothetical protein KSC_015690 [Ktedonobacter sp. SOSP1-52]
MVQQRKVAFTDDFWRLISRAQEWKKLLGFPLRSVTMGVGQKLEEQHPQHQ